MAKRKAEENNAPSKRAKLEEHDIVGYACVGTGRFLRAVFIPAMEELGLAAPFLAQPRGTSFSERMLPQEQLEKRTYDVDTVELSGTVKTTQHAVSGWASLSVEGGMDTFANLGANTVEGGDHGIRIIGVGVTEGGMQLGCSAMEAVAKFLVATHKDHPFRQISVISTDNVPNNGDVIRNNVRKGPTATAMSKKEKQVFLKWLDENVVFHNTMVDRITAHRAGDAFVPRAEPLPSKALVIEDISQVLPPALAQCRGVHVRTKAGEIEKDHQLKLRIANATHTAVVYSLALSRVKDTTACSSMPALTMFLEELYIRDIKYIADDLSIPPAEARAAYDEWVGRLKHPHFGLGSFFITQNSSSKLTFRLMPNMRGAVSHGRQPSVFMSYAIASMMRYLTPMGEQPSGEGVFAGKMDASLYDVSSETEDINYAGGLLANLASGVYTFSDGDGSVPAALQEGKSDPRASLISVVSGIVGSDMENVLFRACVAEAADMYARMIGGTAVADILTDVLEGNAFLTAEGIARAVREEVASVQTIDLHTHLFPPSHGDLMLWGIDELLTYHYLIAEYFMTASEHAPEEFFKMPKVDQAAAIWKHLFVDRTPVSEACQGVVNTLTLLGLSDLVETRDLPGIRAWFAAQDPEVYCEKVFEISGVRYAVMTNIPFEPTEAVHWNGPEGKKTYSSRFRSALRVDPLLKNDLPLVSSCAAAAGFSTDHKGIRDYLLSWVEVMKPEYLMASTDMDFLYPGKDGSADLFVNVLMPLARETGLPLALKVGAQRGLNPRLGGGGDGVVVSDVGILRRMCRDFPDVKFLVTFLSRVNQHELCVVANKTPNLHIYGCWWYLNNPSIIEEMTAMRVELLGTGFTAQHSDARVLDQLLYKWSHSRRVISNVLVTKYTDLLATGWKMTRTELRRDVNRLFGGAYEEFMAKPLK